MRQLKAIRILNGYQASVNIVVGKEYWCPDSEHRLVKSITDTSIQGRYHIACEDGTVLIAMGENVIEQVG